MDGYEVVDPRLGERDVRLFWAKVDQTGGTDTCWPWTGGTMTRGYGLYDRIRRDIGRVTYRAHRLAYLLAVGPIPRGAMILHSCDNPPCCNPAHLRPGTAAENMADVVKRGRHWTAVRPDVVPRGDDHWSRRLPERRARGEEHGSAILTEAQVRAIRRVYGNGGVSQRALATQYGVSQGLIWQVIHRRLWAATA
jgi:hypothetical protein